MVRTKFRGPLVASAIVAIALLVAVRFDVFEGFLAWTRVYDGWQVGGLLVLLLLAVAFAYSYWRGHEELRRQRDLYEGVLAAQSELGEGLVVVENERIRYANDAFCEISGYGMEELKALPSLTELVAQEERSSVPGHLSDDVGNTYYDTTLHRKDGQPVAVEVAFRAVEGKASSWSTAIVRDITGRKRAEEKLREANRQLEELAGLRADFTAMVAHEIGSPLATVRGFLEMLATGELGPTERADVLAKIQTEVSRLSILVADVRSAAAVEQGEFTLMFRRTTVEELLDDAAWFAQTLPGGHDLSVDVAADGGLLVDPYRIGQVLRNLLSNAAKYSPEGAPIGLRALPGKTNGRLRVEVVDRGPGVHPDDAERIFEKFGRGRDLPGRQVYGVGLGLYLSRCIVQAHGSELTLEPASGGGSVFAFELEAAR